MEKVNIIVLGAGISGLATAYRLYRDGFDVTVLEAAGVSGGSMVTCFEEGFLMDFGPNSGLETTPLIRELAGEVGLGDDMIYANAAGGRRYILRGGTLHPLPMTPGAFLSSGLFSFRAKCRLMLEPFIGTSEEGYYQSIADFVRRRLGREFLDYAINPFVSGVYAGNPEKLSVKSAFPKLYRLEERYGGLVKGMIRGAKERKARRDASKQTARMFSFREGMQSFPVALAKVLGDRVRLGCTAREVRKTGRGWQVDFKQGGEDRTLDADVVLSALPAHAAADIFHPLDEGLADHLKRIYYPPVKVMHLGFRLEDIGRKLDGFGFLIPEKEKKAFLGAIWSSVLFPGRAPEGMAAFTLFVGGARNPDFLEEAPECLNQRVLSEFKAIMGITGDPVILREQVWERAIPQYELGYIEHLVYMEAFEERFPGIFLSGNYRGGIAVGDCILQSELMMVRIKRFVENIGA